MWAFMKEMPDIIRVVCYKRTAIRAPTKVCPLADSFSRPMAWSVMAVVGGRMWQTSACSLR